MPCHAKMKSLSINLSLAQREKLHEAARIDGRSLSNFLLMRGIEWAEAHGIQFYGVDRQLPTFGPRVSRVKIAERAERGDHLRRRA